MIARICGTLKERRPQQVVVDVGGVGYRLFVSLATFYELPEEGAEVELLVHTVVRDDAIHLYGFLSPAEREAFGHLLAVSGVGPKLGIGILSGISADELWQAVRAGDAARLCKVPGVGKKTAARMVVDLEGRLPQVEAAAAEPADAAFAGIKADAISALVNLGYPEAKAAKAVEAAQHEAGPQATLKDLLRQALRQLT